MLSAKSKRALDDVFKYLTVKKEIILEETIEIETGLDVNKKKNIAYTEKKIREDHQKYFENDLVFPESKKIKGL